MTASERMRSLFVFLSQSLLQSLSQLVGAGGGLGATGDAFQTSDGFLDIHAVNQSADALQIAGAAADVLHILYLAIFNLKENFAGASAAGLICVLHNLFPFKVVFISTTL